MKIVCLFAIDYVFKYSLKYDQPIYKVTCSQNNLIILGCYLKHNTWTRFDSRLPDLNIYSTLYVIFFSWMNSENSP